MIEISARSREINGIQREIKVKEQKLGTRTSFRYHGAFVSDEDSRFPEKPDSLRIALVTAALAEASLEK